MLTVETIGRIRREHFIKGKTIKEIARDLKVSRNTVRRVLRSGATSLEYERDVQPRPKLGRWTEELGQRGRLCHSRMLFVRAYPSETQEMVFDARDRPFALFKGACGRDIYNNMKTAVETVFGGGRLYNRRKSNSV